MIRPGGLLVLSSVAIFLQACRQPPPVASAASASDAAQGMVALPPDSPKLAQIRVAPVRTLNVPADQVLAPGKLEVNPNRVSNVVLPLPGKIDRVMVRIGDAVKQGDPLVAVESADADTAIAAFLQAEAGLTQAKAAAVKAQADADRLRDLFEHNAVAKKEVLAAENTLTQALAGVDQSAASRRQALRRIEILGLKPGDIEPKVLVRAPISGKILEMSVVPGEYRNDTTSPVIRMADLSTVWVSSDVPESQIRLIKIGERLEIELTAYPGEIFNGRVTRIADTVDPQARTVKVRAELDNRAGRLRPEMFGKIRHVEAVRPLPAVPAGAVIQGDGQNIVFVEMSRGAFQARRVEVGDRIGDQLPVLQGLKAGDRVVVDGAMLLKGL